MFSNYPMGKQFTQELARLITSYGERSEQEGIALKAAALMAPLLLQQPNGKPTYKNNTANLARRLVTWHQENFNELIKECATIQAQLISSRKAPSDTTLAKRVATLVFNGKLKSAISLIAAKGEGRSLTNDGGK